MLGMHSRIWVIGLFSGCGVLVSAVSAAPELRYHEVEAVATSDVALYICAKAYPSGLPALKAKLDKSLEGVHAPLATLRAAKPYRTLYDSQINAMLLTSKQEREQFCKEASE